MHGVCDKVGVSINGDVTNMLILGRSGSNATKRLGSV